MPDNPFKEIATELKGEYNGLWSSRCLQAIGDRFAVSSTAVVRRLFELGVIFYPEYQKLYKKLVDEFEEKNWLKIRHRMMISESSII